MAKANRSTKQRGGRERRISIRAVRRETPDLRKLSRALIDLAIAQAEAEAEAADKQGPKATDE